MIIAESQTALETILMCVNLIGIRIVGVIHRQKIYMTYQLCLKLEFRERDVLTKQVLFRDFSHRYTI